MLPTFAADPRVRLWRRPIRSLPRVRGSRGLRRAGFDDIESVCARTDICRLRRDAAQCHDTPRDARLASTASTCWREADGDHARRMHSADRFGRARRRFLIVGHSHSFNRRWRVCASFAPAATSVPSA